MYVDGEGVEPSKKKTRSGSLPLPEERGKDTRQGISHFAPDGLSGQRHRTDSSLPETAAPVKRPAPDVSTAAEPPAPPRMTPDAALRAEAEAPAGQDEALRQDMDDLEARGAADAGEVAASRTNAESSEALGREALNSAWAVEE